MTDLEKTILDQPQLDEQGNPIIITQTEEDTAEVIS